MHRDVKACQLKQPLNRIFFFQRVKNLQLSITSQAAIGAVQSVDLKESPYFACPQLSCALFGAPTARLGSAIRSRTAHAVRRRTGQNYRVYILSSALSCPLALVALQADTAT